MKEVLKNNKLYMGIKIIISALVSFTLMMDKTLVFNGSIAGKISETYFNSITAKDVIFGIGMFAIIYIIITIFQILSDKIECKVFVKENKRDAKMFFIVFGILIVLWLPYILSYFPGGVFADTIVSINEALGKTKLYNHNPVLHTLTLRFFFFIGGLISETNKISIGLKIYTVFQTLAMAAVLAYFVYWTDKKGLAKKYIVLEIAFFGLFQLFPLYALSIWKDTPFSLVLFLYIIFIADIIYDKGENIKGLKGILHYIVLMSLVVFLRNNGIYIVIATTLLLFLRFRKEILKTLRKFLIATIIAITICYTIQGPVFTMLGMNTEFVESIGVLLQQMCYVVVKDGNITEKQREYINNILPIETIKNVYNPCLVDLVKWNEEFNGKYIDENKKKFFKVWFELLLQNPTAYIKAYMLNTIGFWDMNKANSNSYVNIVMWPTLAGDKQYEQEDYIKNITGNSLRTYLEPRIFVSSAIFLMCLLIGILNTFYKKRYENLLIYMPIVFAWGTIMLAVPVAFSLRYVYILVLTVPLSLIIPFLENKKEQKEEIENKGEEENEKNSCVNTML